MISPYSLTVPGGVQGQILGLARALRAMGESVRVLGPCDGPPPEPFVTPLGNSVPTGANGSIAPIAPDPAAQLRVIRALRDEDFDVLHLHEPMAPGPTITTMLIKPAPIVATFHAAGSSLAYGTFKPVLRRGVHRIDKRFAVSADARDMAREALGGDFEVVWNGVEVAAFDATPAWKSDGPTVFFVARHEERKGLSVLLEAAGELPADVRFWVAGVGPETESLRSLHAGDPRIEWLGEIDDREKIARMKAADVFCAPSLYGESFGIVLLEAMAASTAVVASKLGGYAMVTRDGRDALLVPPGDGPATARAIAELLEDPGARRRFIESGRERVETFSMRRLAERYREAYRAVAGVRA